MGFIDALPIWSCIMLYPTCLRSQIFSLSPHLDAVPMGKERVTTVVSHLGWNDAQKVYFRFAYQTCLSNLGAKCGRASSHELALPYQSKKKHIKRTLSSVRQLRPAPHLIKSKKQMFFFMNHHPKRNPAGKSHWNTCHLNPCESENHGPRKSHFRILESHRIP